MAPLYPFLLQTPVLSHLHSGVCVCTCFTPLCVGLSSSWCQNSPLDSSARRRAASGPMSVSHIAQLLVSSSPAAVLFSKDCKGNLFTKAGTAASQELILFYSEPSSKNNWLCTSSNQSVDLLCKPASIAPLLSHHCSGELSISWECSCMLRFSPRGLSLKIWLVACWHLLWEFGWICACF